MCNAGRNTFMLYSPKHKCREWLDKPKYYYAKVVKAGGLEKENLSSILY